MIHGIGVDLIEISRIKNLYKRQSKLVDRILTINEQHKFNQFNNEQRKMEFLAGRFATKEASFTDIDCVNDEDGKPCIHYEGYKVHVSISHTEHYAMSQVILEV